MTKPRIAGLLAEIEALKTKLLDADQCAARALEGRDQVIKEYNELQGEHCKAKYTADHEKWKAREKERSEQKLLLGAVWSKPIAMPRPGFFTRLMGR